MLNNNIFHSFYGWRLWMWAFVWELIDWEHQAVVVGDQVRKRRNITLSDWTQVAMFGHPMMKERIWTMFPNKETHLTYPWIGRVADFKFKNPHRILLPRQITFVHDHIQLIVDRFECLVPQLLILQSGNVRGCLSWPGSAHSLEWFSHPLSFAIKSVEIKLLPLHGLHQSPQILRQCGDLLGLCW